MSDWHVMCTLFRKKIWFLEMSHDISQYSILANRNTSGIAINENRNTNRIGTHVSWKKQIGTKASSPSPTAFHHTLESRSTDMGFLRPMPIFWNQGICCRLFLADICLFLTSIWKIKFNTNKYLRYTKFLNKNIYWTLEHQSALVYLH